MAGNADKFGAFREICRKIRLNIPDGYAWQWDDRRDMALMTLDKYDAELVFFPLFKEFRDHWSFGCDGEAESLVSKLINSEYGLMPGQTFFTTRPIDNLVLFVAWWPWGQADKISMRVGLFATDGAKLATATIHAHLSRWLEINGG